MKNTEKPIEQPSASEVDMSCLVRCPSCAGQGEWIILGKRAVKVTCDRCCGLGKIEMPTLEEYIEMFKEKMKSCGYAIPTNPDFYRKGYEEDYLANDKD